MSADPADLPLARRVLVTHLMRGVTFAGLSAALGLSDTTLRALAHPDTDAASPESVAAVTGFVGDLPVDTRAPFLPAGPAREYAAAVIAQTSAGEMAARTALPEEFLTGLVEGHVATVSAWTWNRLGWATGQGGRPGTVPAGPARVMLLRFREQRVPWAHLAESTGLGENTVVAVATRTTANIEAVTAHAILRLPEDLAATVPLPADLTDAAPVLAHLTWLRDQQVSLAAICRASGVPRSTVDHLVHDTGGRARVSAPVGRALLGVTVEAALAAESTVDASPAREHLARVLAHPEVTAYQVFRATGVDPKTQRRVLDPARARVDAVVAQRLLAFTVDRFRSTARTEMVDAAAARAHVDRLVARLVTYQQIADTAGVHVSTVQRVHRGESPLIEADTAEWLLGVPGDLAADRVDAGPASDHVTLLVEAGLPRQQIAVLAATSKTTIRDLHNRTVATVAADLAERILAVRPDHQALVSPWAEIGPVREHLAALTDANVTYEMIVRETGTTKKTLTRIANGTQIRVTRDLADRILALHPARLEPEPHTKVSPLGAQRRVGALQANAWPASALATELGLTGLNVMNKKSVTYATHVALKGLYTRLKDVRGPSERTATWAQNQGLLPPDYWDEEFLDDPSYQPRRARYKTARTVIPGGVKHVVVTAPGLRDVR